MRREKPISVVVTAPTRGLVTRLPSLSADLLPTQSGEIQGSILSAASIRRASVVAQNVRYEDGVVCAAPGYQRIQLSSELLQNMVAYWPLQEASGTRFDSTHNQYNLLDSPSAVGGADILSTTGIIGRAALFSATPRVGLTPYLFSTEPAVYGVQASPFTVSFWFLPTIGAGYTGNSNQFAVTNVIIGPAWTVQLIADGRLTFNVSTPNFSGIVTSSASINITAWNYISVVYDPNSGLLTIWLNGVSTPGFLISLASSISSAISTTLTSDLNTAITSTGGLAVPGGNLAACVADLTADINTAFVGTASGIPETIFLTLVNHLAIEISAAGGTPPFAGINIELCANILTSAMLPGITAVFSSAAKPFVYTFSVFQLGNPALPVLQDGFALDEVGVWARALQSGDIAEVYNLGQGNPFPFFGGPFNCIFQADLVNDTPTPLVICSPDSVYSVGEATASNSDGSNSFNAFLSTLFAGAPASRGFNWSADNFSDKVILAQHDNPALYWTPPGTAALPLPGLPIKEASYDGVAVFQNHVLLWRDDNLLWSDLNDFTLYIPIAQTAVAGTLTLTAPFAQPVVGRNVTVSIAAPEAVVLSLSMSGTTAFGPTPINTPLQALLLLTNTGDAPIKVTGIELPDSGVFTGNFAGTIPVGATQDVSIVFNPTQPIPYGGSVVVNSNATTGTSVYPISGTGTGSTAVIDLTSSILNFGNVLVSKSLTSALVITNRGNSTLTITGITLAPSLGFSLSPTSGTVAAGKTLAIAVTFSPIAKALYTSDITVNSNATSGTNFIAVSGTGYNVGDLEGGTVFITDNGTCQFGDRPDGTPVTSGVLTITNVAPSGSARYVTIDTPTLLPDGFTVGAPGLTTLNPQTSTTIAVTFSPTAAQAYGGAIAVPCFNTIGGPALGDTSVFVSGTGTDSGPLIQLSGTLDYGDVPFGSTLDALLTIYNPGGSTLTISSIIYSDSHFSSIITSGTVAAGATLSIIVTFMPAASGSVTVPYSSTVTVTSDAPSSPDIYAATGAGVPLPAPVALVADQIVTLTDTSSTPGQTYYDYYTVISMAGNDLTITPVALTGATPAGNIILVDGVQFFTVNANEAGSTVVSGARMNGPIFKIIPQGDFAYIYKQRSIQSIQYTGLGNGTFFIHNEISGEGLIGRNAATDNGAGRMVFLGWKELYTYEGGPTLQPVCQQYTRQLYAEVDRTNLDAILLFHNENRKEIWVIYPIPGGTFKVLVWNYIEDSATIDLYDASLMITGIGWADWSSDPTWAQMVGTWAELSLSTDWDNLVGASVSHAPIFGSLDNGLRLHGQVYDREGAGYYAVSETMDYDFGAADNFKYVDVVVLALQLNTIVAVPAGAVMYVQTGTQIALGGGAITWSAPFPVLVDGTATLPVKVNPGGAGRYVRLRFYSQDPDVQWRVSQFEIHARPGGFY